MSILRLGLRVINRVEQKLERGVRLRAERDERAEDDDATATNGGINDCSTTGEPLLTTRPPAAQRRGIVARDGGCGAVGYSKDGTVVEEHIDFRLKAESQR